MSPPRPPCSHPSATWHRTWRHGRPHHLRRTRGTRPLRPRPRHSLAPFHPRVPHRPSPIATSWPRWKGSPHEREPHDSRDRRAATALKGLRFKLSTFALGPSTSGLLIVIGAFTNEAFLLPANWLTILQQSSILALLVLAESLVLIAGKFDLSLESTVGLAPMIGGWLVSAAAIGGSGMLLEPLSRDCRDARGRSGRGRYRQRLSHRASEAERLHRHAFHADSIAGHHARHVERQDAL